MVSVAVVNTSHEEVPTLSCFFVPVDQVDRGSEPEHCYDCSAHCAKERCAVVSVDPVG